jgi:hypothetical protein
MKDFSILSLSQNAGCVRVGFGKGFRKSGQKPALSFKSNDAFPKTADPRVLGKHLFIFLFVIVSHAFSFEENDAFLGFSYGVFLI